jgi:hypothetical protein
VAVRDDKLNMELYRQLFRSRGITLGDAIKSAKAAVSDSDVRSSWILLGDPAMRLRYQTLFLIYP